VWDAECGLGGNASVGYAEAFFPPLVRKSTFFVYEEETWSSCKTRKGLCLLQILTGLSASLDQLEKSRGGSHEETRRPADNVRIRLSESLFFSPVSRRGKEAGGWTLESLLWGIESLKTGGRLNWNQTAGGWGNNKGLFGPK